MSDVTKLMMKVKELTNAIQSLDAQTITKDQLSDALEFVGVSRSAKCNIVNRAFPPEQNELAIKTLEEKRDLLIAARDSGSAYITILYCREIGLDDILIRPRIQAEMFRLALKDIEEQITNLRSKNNGK